MQGYMGKILLVDLSERTFAVEPLDPDLCRRFVGGRGFGAKLLFDRLEAGTEPFSPENMVILATGPLTGTPATGSKLSVITKSPAGNGYGDSHVGGQIGPALRATGHDVVIIRGKADRPTYLRITPAGAEFCDASELWGKGCFDAERALLEGHRGEWHALVIGPAGEKLVRFACLGHDFGRQAGRCGMGAVFGSKNLKAVICRGDQALTLADPETFLEKSEALVKHIKTSEQAQLWHEQGTALHVEHSNEVACLPTRNHSCGQFELADKIDALAMKREIVERDKACHACPMVCGKYSVVRKGPWAGTKIDGPEYEILALMGSNVGVGDLGAIARANYLADDLGLDAISAGNVCAFAMECFEKGILTTEDTGGLNLQFGNAPDYHTLLERIAHREGIGDLLAEGVARASKKIGKGSEVFAMHSKGLEQSGYETRGGIAQVLGYSVNDRGADHNRVWNVGWFEGEQRHDPKGKAEQVKLTQCRRSAPDIMGTCRFVSYYIPFDDFGTLIHAATGMEHDEKSIIRLAERVYNLTRVFNYREGYSKASDHVPRRIFEEPVPSGITKGVRVDKATYEALRQEFYAISGWDENGIPTDEQLEALDLADLIPQAKALR